MASRSESNGRTAAEFLPTRLTLPALRRAAESCRGCDLYKRATQTVFGEGPRDASLIAVGETPGDQEDKLGHPFVGPAGRLLDECLAAAGLHRSEVYLTNAVKHFKWEERGKRRMHKKPRRTEVVACRAWLEAEIFVIKPKVIVCLGATAAQALLGREFRITRQRGQLVASSWSPWALATWHPSAVLRAPTPEDRAQMRQQLTDDLRHAAQKAA